MQNEKLLVFNIQKYSLHDGSGIRTVVFLKGCPLRCRWCCNPESQSENKEIMYRRQKCLGKDKCGLCGRCDCHESVTFDDEGKAVLDFHRANENVDWTSVCPTKALSIEGKEMSITEILDIVERDAVFYRGDDGGLTVSGGEPLNQASTVDLLRGAKERHLRTAIETCGLVNQERLIEAAKYLDEIFFDIKSLNDEKHKEYTGVENRQIRENLKALYAVASDKPITVRTPVIPGFNDTELELGEIEEFLKAFPHIQWQKLPYHTYGKAKYEMLGRAYLL